MKHVAGDVARTQWNGFLCIDQAAFGRSYLDRAKGSFIIRDLGAEGAFDRVSGISIGVIQNGIDAEHGDRKLPHQCE